MAFVWQIHIANSTWDGFCCGEIKSWNWSRGWNVCKLVDVDAGSCRPFMSKTCSRFQYKLHPIHKRWPEIMGQKNIQVGRRCPVPLGSFVEFVFVWMHCWTCYYRVLLKPADGFESKYCNVFVVKCIQVLLAPAPSSMCCSYEVHFEVLTSML